MKSRKSNRDEVRENTLSLLMRKEEKRRVQDAAEKMGISMSSFVRIVLCEYLERKGL